MARVVYCRGAFMPEGEATVGLFDRGYLFGDAIYEVTAVLDGRMIDNDLHLARLERSAEEIGMPLPLSADRIEAVQRELIARNGLREGVIYLQVSRGEADRDFLYPAGLAPVLVGFTQARPLVGTPAQQRGIAVDLAPDPRWQRRDIKTVMLLGQVMAKRAAQQAGFADVWLVEDGLVTEGASSTAWIVTPDRRIVTRPNSRLILPGCTRRALLRLCAEHDLTVVERAFSPAEAQAAAEAFQTSASSLVTPVVQIGSVVIGDGAPGPVTRALQSYYLEAAGVPAVAVH